MPRINRRKRARRSTALTDDQEWDLILGTVHAAAFSSPKEREEAWFRHREILLKSVNPTTRPSAFWDYEAKKLPREKDLAALVRLGLLTAEEKRLLQRWKHPSAPPEAKD